MDHKNSITVEGSSDSESSNEFIISSSDVSIDGLSSSGSELSIKTIDVPAEKYNGTEVIADPLELEPELDQVNDENQPPPKKRKSNCQQRIGKRDESIQDSNKQTLHSSSESDTDVRNSAGPSEVQVVPQKINRRRKSQRILKQKVKKIHQSVTQPKRIPKLINLLLRRIRRRRAPKTNRSCRQLHIHWRKEIETKDIIVGL